MKLTVVYEVSGEVSCGSALTAKQVLEDALPNGIFAVNTFLQSEGHTLKLKSISAELAEPAEEQAR